MEAFTKQATNESLETGLLGQTAQQLGFLFQDNCLAWLLNIN